MILGSYITSSLRFLILLSSYFITLFSLVFFSYVSRFYFVVDILRSSVVILSIYFCISYEASSFPSLLFFGISSSSSAAFSLLLIRLPFSSIYRPFPIFYFVASYCSLFLVFELSLSCIFLSSSSIFFHIFPLIFFHLFPSLLCCSFLFPVSSSSNYLCYFLCALLTLLLSASPLSFFSWTLFLPFSTILFLPSTFFCLSFFRFPFCVSFALFILFSSSYVSFRFDPLSVFPYLCSFSSLSVHLPRPFSLLCS